MAHSLAVVASSARLLTKVSTNFASWFCDMAKRKKHMIWSST